MTEYRKSEDGGKFYLTREGKFYLTPSPYGDLGTGSGMTMYRFDTATEREYFIQIERLRYELEWAKAELEGCKTAERKLRELDAVPAAWRQLWLAVGLWLRKWENPR